MKQWTYPSSSGGSPYTTTLQDNGCLMCNCRGFIVKKKDKPRTCRHVDDVIKKHGLNTVRRADFLFSTGDDPQTIVPPDPVDFSGNLAQAEADGYVNPMLGQAIALSLPKTLTPQERNDAFWQHITNNYMTGYLWEEKWDGQRVVVAVKQSQSVKAWSRPRPGEGTLGHPRVLPPHLIDHLKALPDGTYDGEDVVPGGRSWAVTDQAFSNQKAIVLFDLLKLQGWSLMDQPIEMRRHMLAEILKLANSPYLLMSETFTPGRPAVEAIWARGGEGAMIKRAGSLYRPGWRSPDWIKVKLWEYEAAELTGFEARKEGPHAVMLFKFRDGVESKCKTLGNKWLKEFDANSQKYVGQWFIVKYQGRTDKERKPRHPQFDHFAAPEELK